MEPEQLIEHFEKIRVEAEHPVAFLTGQAGTGKTYSLLRAIKQDLKFAVLCATTGIAGINIGATTINQVLKYFNTQSLQDAYQSGLLQRQLKQVRERARFLVVDEASMLPFQQLDNLIWALDEINDGDNDKRLGLILTGDFAQLPPVPGPLLIEGRPKIHNGREVKEPTPFAFKSKEWPRFDAEGHTIKLEKIWRQSDPTFLEGINAIRRGVGSLGVPLLASAGVEFARDMDSYFDGTTIVAKNEEVDRVNRIRLNQLPGEDYHIPSERWWASEVRGWKQPSEWQYIPDRLQLKVGAYIMLLANNVDPLTRELIYCNGDCGHIREVRRIAQPVYDYSTELAEDEKPKQIGEEVTWVVFVELARNRRVVGVSAIKRMIESRHEPDEDMTKHPKFPRSDTGEPVKVRNAMGKMVWCLGSIDYMPLRLAYASTVHKCISVGSMLQTPSGLRPARTISKGDLILGCNIKLRQVEWVTVMAVSPSGKKPAIRIVTLGQQSDTDSTGLRNERQIICSLDHRFPVMIVGGAIVDLPASDLRINDKLIIATTNGELSYSYIVSMVYDPFNDDDVHMLDIEVTGDHYFFANEILTHNCQGLSLDRIQIDPRNQFYSQPGMVYVALSRGRTPQGIRVVGTQQLLAERVKIDPQVLKFA